MVGGALVVGVDHGGVVVGLGTLEQVGLVMIAAADESGHIVGQLQGVNRL